MPSKFRFTQDQFGEILGKKAGSDNSIKLTDDWIHNTKCSKRRKALTRDFEVKCYDDSENDEKYKYGY